MTNQELYKQAILDAKAVRETAMAAAKESLAEAFEPRIKEMLRLKLSEELEETTDMEESTDMEEYAEQQPKDEKEAHKMSESDMEESTLDEILAELDALSEDDSKMEEAKKDKMEEAKDDEAGEEPTEDAIEEPATDDAMAPEEMGSEDDEQVVDITVGELKDIFRDVFAQLQGGAAPEATDTLDEPVAGSEEISLEEILAELEMEESKMEEAAFIPGDAKAVAKGEVGSKAELEEKKKMEDELEEAKKAIHAMRSELQEVNLLNAKLLYVNKIWKGKSLSESQKVKVLNAFDRATTVKEAENIFKTLNESMVAPKKTDLRESMGFASKSIGTAPAKPIVEVDSMVARWKTIAGIK